MALLNQDQMNKAKNFIFQNGRLLERKLFEYFFENGTKQACLKALVAYQNEDGGFGNGIEADLLCPDSTVIGAETAMFVLEMLECYDREMLDPLVSWMVANQNEEGFVPHPPKNMFNYPYQPWWQNPDDYRILVLVSLLKKWGIKHDELFNKARKYYERVKLPEKLDFYSYPYLVYLKYCSETQQDRENLSTLVAKLPALLSEHADHFPLFSRYWFYASDEVENVVLHQEAQKFVNAFQDDGGIWIPYPDLPWWRPVFTLDGLILLKRHAFIDKRHEGAKM